MKTCPKCYKEIPPDSEFCPYCGEAIKEEVTLRKRELMFLMKKEPVNIEKRFIRCEIMAPLCVILVMKRSQDALIKISFASGDKGKDR